MPPDTDIHEQLFNSLFQEYEGKLFLFVIKVLHSEELARDLVQDVFLKLWTIRDQLPDMDNAGAYLYRMAENRVYDYLRAAASRADLRNQLWEQMQQHTQETPAFNLEVKEYDQVIRRAIDQLPEQRRAIYLMNKQEGMKYKEIASELNISPHTVRNQLTEAFRQIGAYVKKHFSSFL